MLNQRHGQAIEVAAMLDDSVVEVKHLMHQPASSGKRRVATWFCLGAALLTMAAVAFGVSVDNAATNAAALKEWTEVLHKPHHDFRPARLSPIYDVIAFGGAFGGLFAVAFGLVAWRSRRVESVFRIARTGADASVAQADTYPLVAPDGDGFACNVSADWDGEVIEGGEMTPLSAAIARGTPSTVVPGAVALPIPDDGRIRIRRGKTTYILANVPAPREHDLSMLARVESRAMYHFLGSAIAHAAALILLFSIPPDAETLALDTLGSGRERLIKARINVNEPPVMEPVPVIDDGQTADDREDGNAGGAEMADAGKMGVQDSANADGRFKIKKRRETPSMSRSDAIARATDTGIVRVFGAAGGAQDPFATLTGTAELYSSGMADRDIYGGYTGDEFRDAKGGWGSGPDGFGPGGGGDNWGTIGTGRYATIGDTGYGNKSITNFGRPPGKNPRRTPKHIDTVKIGEAETGGYDKSLIRREIRKHLRQIRHCYEKQLLVERDLEGTVTTTFVINPQGAVISMSAGGIGSKPVETCVGDVVASISFPKPKLGGMHRVVYPFHLRPAGSR